MTKRSGTKNNTSGIKSSILRALADKIGTPYWIYDACVLRQRIADIRQLTRGHGLQSRYAMKACPATRIVREMLANDIWIDAVSGNEVLRALKAGYRRGMTPPQVLFTADAFRDGALDICLKNRIMPNIGSAGMIGLLANAGYKGPIGIRVNPGFGHGHVNACDTGGPSSKHGIWYHDLKTVARDAARRGLKMVLLHAHIGSGPKPEELLRNFRKLAKEFEILIADLPHVEAVSLGGGIPHAYREEDPQIDIAQLAKLLVDAREELCRAAGRSIRLEIEPGRYFVAPCCSLVARVTDVKSTTDNEKGRGQKFAMVDAGFCDLIRPAMYDSYHEIIVADRADDKPSRTYTITGPICETGDTFAMDRQIDAIQTGDLAVFRTAGAYGATMASSYNSRGFVAEVMVDGGKWAVVADRILPEAITAAERVPDFLD